MRRLGITSVACVVALGFSGTGAGIGSSLLSASPAGATGPAGPVAYSAIPATIPGNVASLGFEATATAEFGDEVGLASHATPLAKARVLMSSWACETGHWNDVTCTTTPGATFSVPVTFNVYAVDNTGSTPAPGATRRATPRSMTARTCSGCCGSVGR